MKVGVGSPGDATRLHNGYDILVKGIIDLKAISNNLEPTYTGQRTLAALTLRHTGRTLLKPRPDIFGPWVTLPLLPNMVTYAVGDAGAGRDIYIHLLPLATGL